MRKMYGSAEYADKSIAAALFGLKHADHLGRGREKYPITGIRRDGTTVIAQAVVLERQWAR